MPRLLPRFHVFKSGRSASLISPTEIIRKPRRFTGKHLKWPSLSPRGRKQSILLDRRNPVNHPGLYKFHKAPAPRTTRTRTFPAKQKADYNACKDMTRLEQQWHSSPYLRMLASPIRRCAVSERYLPSDFLIRLTPLRVKDPSGQSTRDRIYILPDGIRHPRYSSKKSGHATYIQCRREALAEFETRRLAPRIIRDARIHTNLTQHITYHLQCRIIEEIEQLSERLRTSPSFKVRPVKMMTRLTRVEWASVQKSGSLDAQSILAVIIAPPVNPRAHMKAPANNSSSKPASESLPVLVPSTSESKSTSTSTMSTSGTEPRPSLKNYHPPSSFLSDSDPASERRVPLYNAAGLFPEAEMRNRLHKNLANLLRIEAHIRHREGGPAPHRSGKGDDKGSHAILLNSSADTQKRADSVPLAIALWRLRMWLGLGWQWDQQNVLPGTITRTYAAGAWAVDSNPFVRKSRRM